MNVLIKSIVVTVGLGIMGSAMAECRIDSPYEELINCIVAEGAYDGTEPFQQNIEVLEQAVNQSKAQLTETRVERVSANNIENQKYVDH